MSSKELTKCRACGHDELTTVLDLGMMPLANNLEETQIEALNAQRFPLEVVQCKKCQLTQLSQVVDPDLLFSHYTYRSSINGGYKIHCEQMAKDIIAKYPHLRDLGRVHFDIAGNDGALIESFNKVIRFLSVNIDPAENLCKISIDKGIKTVNEFWNKDIQLGVKADLITATNVFAHVDDIHGFVEGIAKNLNQNGICVIEFPYLYDFLDNNEYDTVYFEHLSYFHIAPIEKLLYKYGLIIREVSRSSIHGGTVRLYISHRFGDDSIGLKGLQTKTDKHKAMCLRAIRSLLEANAKIVGFAASAKGNTLLNYFGLNYNDIPVIIDQTPEKVGKFSPGTGIEIVDIDWLESNNPDYILILAWNFKDEIIAKLRPLTHAKFIVLMPHFEIIQ